jgi:hypothetical protein
MAVAPDLTAMDDEWERTSGLLCAAAPWRAPV